MLAVVVPAVMAAWLAQAAQPASMNDPMTRGSDSDAHATTSVQADVQAASQGAAEADAAAMVPAAEDAQEEAVVSEGSVDAAAAEEAPPPPPREKQFKDPATAKKTKTKKASRPRPWWSWAGIGTGLAIAAVAAVVAMGGVGTQVAALYFWVDQTNADRKRDEREFATTRARVVQWTAVILMVGGVAAFFGGLIGATYALGYGNQPPQSVKDL